MTNTLTKTNITPWLIVALLFVIALLNYIDRTMITTMRESIVGSIPMSDAQFGLLTAVFLWIYGLFSPFAGFLADRYSKSRVIIFSLFVWSLVTWMTSLATTFQELLITRALMGISEACYIPAALSLIMDYHTGRTRSLATGVHMAGIMLGQSLGFLGGWIAEYHTWNYAFSIFGIFGVFYAIFLLFFLKDVPKLKKENQEIIEEKVQFIKAIGVLFRKRSYILILCFFGLISIVSWLIVGWLPTYFKEKFDLSQTQAGIYSTGYVFTFAILGVLIGGYLTDLWSKRNNKSRILVPFVGLCVAAPAIFIASYSTVIIISLVCFIVYTFFKSFTDANTMPILTLVVEPKYRSTGYGFLNFCGTIVGGLGLYFGGSLRDSNIDLELIFRLASILIIIAAVCLFLVKPNKDLINED